MPRKRLKLFKLLGFEVYLDPSWIFIAVLISWSLSANYFPLQYKSLSKNIYWLMGITGALGLFLSVIAHELSHSLIARRFGITMNGITLFIFGGVAEMGEEPASPKAEFFVAIVGPLSSLAIAALSYALGYAGTRAGVPPPMVGVVMYLAFINSMLALFNLIPAFPLDGGRVLRSILWAVKGNVGWATKIASSIGIFVGLALAVYGMWRMLLFDIMGGLWMLLIGFFLQNAAKASYQQLIVRKALEGEPVRRFMNTQPVTVAPDLTVDKLVDDYFYRYHHDTFPVIDSGNLAGCVFMDQVKEVPKSFRTQRTVAEIVRPCGSENTIDPQTEATKLLSLMNRNGSSRFMVVEGDKLVGVISSRDMVKFISLKMELEN